MSSEHTFAHTFKLSEEFVAGRERSVAFTFEGLYWRTVLKLEEKEGKRLVGVYLECEGPVDCMKPDDGWQCYVSKGRLSLSTQPNDKPLIQLTFSPPPEFTSNKNSWGWPSINEANALLIQNGRKGNLIVEWSFTAERPKGPYFRGQELKRLHLSSLSADLSMLLDTNDGSDFALVSKQGDSFPCHKLILSARSPVFKAMLCSGMKEAEEDVATMDDIGSEAMKLLLKFLYTGTLSAEVAGTKNYNAETFVELLAATDQYELPQLVQLPAHALFIRREPGNALDLLQALRVYKDQVPDVMEDFRQYMIDNVSSVMKDSL